MIPQSQLLDGEPALVHRLKLKPKAPTVTGYVDGAWWPRSRDLAEELPALLSVLAVRTGPIERMSYHLTEWDPPARTIVVDGALVHLGGYRTQPAHTVDLLAARMQVTLLVVPPDTEPEAAHRMLTAAGHRDNSDTVAHLLSAGTRPPTETDES
jgi:hypothetical protein